MMFRLTYLLVPIAVFLIFRHMKKEVVRTEQNILENDFIIQQSKTLLGIAIVIMLIVTFLITMLIIFIDGAPWFIYLILFLSYLFCGWLACFRFVWRVSIKGDEIHFRNTFGRQKSFNFSDIKKAKIKKFANPDVQEVTLHSEKGRIVTVDSYLAGYHLLVEQLEQKSIKFELKKPFQK